MRVPREGVCCASHKKPKPHNTLEKYKSVLFLTQLTSIHEQKHANVPNTYTTADPGAGSILDTISTVSELQQNVSHEKHS